MEDEAYDVKIYRLIKSTIAWDIFKLNRFQSFQLFFQDFKRAASQRWLSDILFRTMLFDIVSNNCTEQCVNIQDYL